MKQLFEKSNWKKKKSLNQLSDVNIKANCLTVPGNPPPQNTSVLYKLPL